MEKEKNVTHKVIILSNRFIFWGQNKTKKIKK